MFFLIVFLFSFFLIFYAMVGYPIALMILEKILRPKVNLKNEEYEPSVTYMIVAHNEEKVIEKKLNNALDLDYPIEKFEILVASDNSTDATNTIVERFILKYPNRKIRLYCTKEHKGKTNAQNEAQKTINSEVIVMTDANSIVREDAIRELVSYFSTDEIAYVCGKLVYSNAEDTNTSQSESSYWNLDLKLRDIESRIKTITAGNGALYACKNSEYLVARPIDCHDSYMPLYYALQGKRAIFNPNAIAFEKAGETDEDEFKRKVRMSRDIIGIFSIIPKTINFFKYGWFSFFYFGHRICRYLLWLSHILMFISTLILSFRSLLCKLAVFAQTVFFCIGYLGIKKKSKNGFIRMVSYYSMTVFAQLCGAKNGIMGNSKATWEKAESTR